MEPRSQTSATLEPLPVPVEELYRMSPEVYRGMVAHGLLNGSDRVTLADGLIVHETAEIEGGSTDPIDRLYRIPLEVYHGIVDSGLLGPSDKVVLLDGVLVKKMGRNNPHIMATKLTMRALGLVLPVGWHLGKEDPIALPAGPAGRASEPEPDVTVVRGGIRDYLTRKPSPADTALVVEVADSSLRKDRVGLARYSWTNIPVTWIINVNERTVEVYSRPTGPVAPAHYQEAIVFGEADEVPVVIDGLEVGKVAVKDLLP